MSPRIRPRRAAVALLVAAGCLSGCSIGLESLPAPDGTDGPTFHITAQFRDVENLSLGAKVKLGGVVVGDVHSIGTHDYLATVGMDIEQKFALGKDTRLQVRFTTPLGDEFISVTSAGHPAAGKLVDGGTVPVSQTGAAPNIEDTFAAVSTLLNYGGLDKLHIIATQLDLALHGRTSNARRALENLQKVVAVVDSHKSDVDAVLDGLNTLAGTLASDTSTIDRALAVFPDALSQLADDTAKVRQLLVKVGKLGVTVKGLLARGQNALLTDFDNLRPTLNALRARDDELIPTFKALTKLGASFRRAAPGDYLNISATIDFLLGAPPARPKAHGTKTVGSAEAVHQLVTMGAGS